MLIGITGKKRRGKDTVANYLCHAYNYNKHGFADKVKEWLYAVNPLVLVTYQEIEAIGITQNFLNEANCYHISGIGWMVAVQDLVDYLGWEEAKEIEEIRKHLQRVGTEGGRNIFGVDFWKNELFNFLEKKYDTYRTGLDQHKEFQSNIAIFDIRFDNEAEGVRERGGKVFEVVSEREGLPEPDGHSSENGVSRHLIDVILHNDGPEDSVPQLVEKALTMNYDEVYYEG